MLEMGHAEPVSKGEPVGQVWYIPHHESITSESLTKLEWFLPAACM